MKKITILVLSCGTNACFNFCKQIKKHFDQNIKLVGVDINPPNLVSSSPYLDAFYQVYKNTDDAYYQQILTLIRQEKADYLLPSFDRDQQLFYPENCDLQALKCISLGSSEKILKFYGNKVKTMEVLKNFGFNVPRQFLIEEITLDKKYFMKPIDGVASIGAKAVYGKELLAKSSEILNGYVIQELCFTPEITLECFWSKDFFSYRCRERIFSKAGVCVKTKVFQDEKLAEVARRFIGHFNPPHVFNLQFMKNPEGNWVITDVNLRFAGGGSLSLVSGWDYASALGALLLNEPSYFKFVPQMEKKQIYAVTIHDAIVTSQSDTTIVVDLDGTLLDSRLRHVNLLDDILKKMSYPLDTADYLSCKCQGMSTFQWLISKGLDSSTASYISTQWKERIESNDLLSQDRLYPNCIDFLLRLSRISSLHLVTARANSQNLYGQLQSLGIYGYFESVSVVSPSKGENSKLEVINKIHPDYVIGDTETDFKAAQFSGAEFLAFTHGFRSPDYLKSIGCSRLFNSFSEVINYLNNKN